MSRRRFAAVLAAIAITAFAGRAVYVMTVTHDDVASPDELYYRNAAIGLAHGDGFKVPPAFGAPGLDIAEHPPLTSVVLAPVAWLSDDSEVAMRLTVAAAGAAVVALLGLAARGVAGARAGLVAAGIAAVYPNLWANDGLLMSETFATLFTAVAVLCTYRLVREPTWPNAAAVGLACGLAMLSRGELALLVPLLVAPAVTTMPGLTARRRLRLLAATVLATSVLVAPWAGYNLARFEEPVLISYGDGGVLLGANCDETYSGPLLGSWYGFCAPFSEPEVVTDLSVEAAHKRRLGLDYAGEHRGRLPLVMAARVGRAWSVYRPFQSTEISDGEGRPRWVSRAGWVTYALLMGAAVAGALALRRRRVPLWPLVAPAALVTAVAAAFYGAVRFRSPAEVSVVVLAAVAVDGWLERSAAATSPRPGTARGRP